MSLQPPEPGAVGGEPLKIWNCVNCRRRKVRCDRRHPCAPCIKNKIECVFPVSGRIPSRSRIGDRAAQKQVELVGRLRRLEAMVGGLGSQVENAAAVTSDNHSLGSSTGALESATSSEKGSGVVKGTSESPQASKDFGVLEVTSNGDLVVGEGFWTVFCKEVEDIFEAVQGHTVMHFDDGSSSSMSDVSPHTGYYNFLLRSTSAARQKKDVYPLPSQLLFLWQIYMDNVDPFIKILHTPTMTKVIREIRSSYETLGPSMQALVLAVSLAAIMSLQDDEVKANFNADKDDLFARFRLGTEQALQQADFLNHPDMTLLQALAIYLSVLQHTGEMKSAWVLAGVLVRLAVSMKLHVDGSKLANIMPFEVEMRRRLWWQICLIDSKSENVQISAYKLSEDMFDTEIPTNTGDSNLDPSMSRSPLPSQGWTDMTVFLLRCEIWRLSHQVQSITDMKEKREIFKSNEARIEVMYLKHLDPNQPLQSFLATSVRLFLAKVNLMLPLKPYHHNQTHPTEPAPRHEIFMSCLSLIEYTHALQNEPVWNGWRWQIRGGHLPWNALRSVLGQLSSRDWEPLYDRAFTSSKALLDALPGAARSDTRYQQLLALLSTAQRRADGYHHYQGSNQPLNIPAETYSGDLNLSRPFAQTSINENGLDGVPQESFLDMTEYPDAEMDWQAWNEIAGDLEIWDMGSL